MCKRLQLEIVTFWLITMSSQNNNILNTSNSSPILKKKTQWRKDSGTWGEISGQLKDKVIDLNGKAINSFSSIAHEVIQLVGSGKTSYSIYTIEKNLEIAFGNFDWELKRLINSIDDLVPLTSRAASLGLQVSERIYKEHYRLQVFQDRQPLWAKLLDQTSKRGKQLHQDLRLTTRSIQTARALHTSLEEVKSDLVSYRNHVSHFKAVISGWHLADHGLSAKDKLESMKLTINQLQGTISSAKQNSKMKEARVNVDL
ncbi:hypothetical protein MJO29_012359 [Puccinia striiformis f. sp. tritici]|nr:hypothetical protein MJO29_012359 [Puccinia striiformis f. sp. tritici]